MTAASMARATGEGKWITLPAIMLVASMLTLARSYLVLKLIFLTIFLLAFLVSVYFGRTRVVVYRRLAWFYLLISIAGVVWALVGTLHPANYFQGILESLRLYVVWSGAFAVLYTLLKAGRSLQVMHTAVVVAGILIPLVNFVGLYDQYSGMGLISNSVLQELDLRIGFNDGYIQITSQNIGSMFLIVPYLIALQFRADSGTVNSILTKLALVLSLILVVISGRRALWLVVAMTPLTILLLSSFTDSYGLIRTRGKRFLFVCAVAGAVGLGTLLTVPESGLDVGSINHLKNAFSSEDERTIQGPYLINGFLKSPVFGSGFGAFAGYLRSDERPWTYELTYHNLLFNTGIVGTAFLVTLFSVYFALVVRLLRRFKKGSAIPFALLVAFFSLLIGAYSNPYFGSFDFLFFAGLLSYVSTFEHGFDEQKSMAVLAVVPCSL